MRELSLEKMGLVLVIGLVLVSVLGLNVFQKALVKPASSPIVFTYEPTKVTNTTKTITATTAKIAAMPRAIINAPITSAVPLPIMPPQVLNRVSPNYPASSLKNGEEGMVLLSALVSASGAVEEVKLLTSSGFEQLDVAAQKAIALWKFSPAQQGENALLAQVEIPVRFEIK